MLLPLFLSMALAQTGEKIDTVHIHISLPGVVSPQQSGVESTPWGEATTVEYSSNDQGWFKYTLTAYNFKRPTPLSVRKLKKAKAFFLRNRGCAANEIHGRHFQDSEGHVWPQIYLSGQCIADSGFRTLFLIAKGHLYRFCVAYELTHLPDQTIPEGSYDSAPPPPPPPSPSPARLDQAIKEFIAGSHFKTPGDSAQ